METSRKPKSERKGEVGVEDQLSHVGPNFERCEVQRVSQFAFTAEGFAHAPASQTATSESSL